MRRENNEATARLEVKGHWTLCMSFGAVRCMHAVQCTHTRYRYRKPHDLAFGMINTRAPKCCNKKPCLRRTAGKAIFDAHGLRAIVVETTCLIVKVSGAIMNRHLTTCCVVVDGVQWCKGKKGQNTYTTVKQEHAESFNISTSPHSEMRSARHRNASTWAQQGWTNRI